ncbi:hypothetical protein CYMTET_36662 [Cymbomonas tetramitiformis]|uniref:SAM domain-containing protein n=1 Tax=Cymbomonas tetramitiformis TaxID=36881 RepID=A0AAE0CFI5_9CHLO|nr:hypothetical protein CYMTET_36662 [Cymbomonas tetramitiformis]
MDELLLNRAHAVLGEGSRLVCPVSGRLAENPVVASDGHTYNRASLVELLQRKQTTSAVTGEPLIASISLDNLSYSVAIEEIVRVADELQQIHAQEMAEERGKSQATVSNLQQRVSLLEACMAGKPKVDTTLRGATSGKPQPGTPSTPLSFRTKGRTIAGEDENTAEESPSHYFTSEKGMGPSGSTPKSPDSPAAGTGHSDGTHTENDPVVDEWLTQLGLSMYAPAFAVNGVDLPTLLALTEDDLLVGLDVKNRMHRVKMLARRLEVSCFSSWVDVTKHQKHAIPLSRGRIGKHSQLNTNPCLDQPPGL